MGIEITEKSRAQRNKSQATQHIEHTQISIQT